MQEFPEAVSEVAEHMSFGTRGKDSEKVSMIAIWVTAQKMVYGMQSVFKVVRRSFEINVLKLFSMNCHRAIDWPYASGLAKKLVSFCLLTNMLLNFHTGENAV